MNALLIPADPSPIRTVEVQGLGDLQALVGGDIQTIPYPGPGRGRGRGDVAPYFNEDGKALGLPYNDRATRLLSRSLFADDHIAGACLLTGSNPAGELADLPADVLDDVARGAK